MSDPLREALAALIDDEADLRLPDGRLAIERDRAIALIRYGAAALSTTPAPDLDRLRAIEDAARAVCDQMVQDGGGSRWWDAIGRLRAALEGDTHE